MRAPVTVLTATIPGREVLLLECLESVYRQTVEVEAHLVLAQSCTEGLPSPVHCAKMQNALLASVATEWTMRLADDDLLLPDHVAVLMPYFPEADVIYSWDASGNRPRWNANPLPSRVLIESFERTSWIDGSAVAIRTEWLSKVNGWPEEYVGRPPFEGHFAGFPPTVTCEDHGCFLALARAGARFLCVPEESWVYRAGGWPRISMEA
jgi:hypothetical protein